MNKLNDTSSEMQWDKRPASKSKSMAVHPGWGRSITFVLIILLCVAFATIYLSHETPGHFWDYDTYHGQIRWFTGSLKEGRLLQVLLDIIRSLLKSDYNASPVVPLLPISFALGDSRLVYILSLVILYLIPASIVLALVIQECWKARMSGISFWLALGCVLLYPMFWVPTLRGYADIVALIPMGLAGLTLLRTNWLLHASAGQSLLVGLLLWSTFLLRRHYAYTIVATIAVSLGFAVWKLAQSGDKRRTLLGRLQRNTLLAGTTLTLPALIIQGPLVLRILTTSYTSIYSAYQTEAGNKLTTIYSWNGPFWILLVVCGALYALHVRNSKAIYCLCVGLLSYGLFQRTQAPGIHHMLPFAFWLAPVAAWPLVLINNRATLRCRVGVGALLLGLISAVSLPQLSWAEAKASPFLSWSKPLQAKTSFPPFKIESYPALMDLVTELRKPEYANKQLLILASSEQLNSSIIASLSPDLAPRVFPTPSTGDVDLRDGFSVERLEKAEYIITTWKPALHLPEKHQQVVVVPVRALFDPRNPLARSYKRIPDKSFKLSDGTTAYIFKRTFRPNPEALNWLTDEFRKHYPTWEVKNGIIGP